LHFGLGADASAQAVQIRWPSGIVQELKNMHGDQLIRVDEPDAVASPDLKRKQ
jgi:enediyne biosynthesis protein E4